MKALLIQTGKVRNILDNRELIKLCLLEDQKGQRLLYERYVTSMARLCLRYIKDADEVQDILIDGFMKVFEMLKKFEYRDENSLEVWIRKIMINECLMHLRKKRRFVFNHLGEDMQTSQVDNIDLHSEEIFAIIQLLPDGYRTIFNLFVIDGYTHKAIGELLGISESASRSQLTHARNKLKKLLIKHGWDEK